MFRTNIFQNIVSKNMFQKKLRPKLFPKIISFQNSRSKLMFEKIILNISSNNIYKQSFSKTICVKIFLKTISSKTIASNNFKSKRICKNYASKVIKEYLNISLKNMFKRYFGQTFKLKNNILSKYFQRIF